MEALQLAQMLADLNDLQAAQDQNAAKALVSASKTLDRIEQVQPTPTPPRGSDAAPGSPPAGPRRMTDKFGRRIFSPPISRANSAVAGTPASAPSTPRDEVRPLTVAFLRARVAVADVGFLPSHQGADTDIDRASTLLSLYELRARVREQDNSSLVKAREKVSALAAKQQRTSTDLASRYNYPK
ncbi:hypothetical protein MN608_04630 [Microdochium nivale]|nr:hypothetical protein MN608_04630 [Microdochium nivale]